MGLNKICGAKSDFFFHSLQGYRKNTGLSSFLKDRSGEEQQRLPKTTAHLPLDLFWWIRMGHLKGYERSSTGFYYRPKFFILGDTPTIMTFTGLFFGQHRLWDEHPTVERISTGTVQSSQEQPPFRSSISIYIGTNTLYQSPYNYRSVFPMDIQSKCWSSCDPSVLQSIK